MKNLFVILISCWALTSCHSKKEAAVSIELINPSRDEFVIHYLQQAFNYSFKDISKKNAQLLKPLSAELKMQKQAEFEKLIPKIVNGKISQVGELKSLSKLSRDAYLAELQIAILEDTKVNQFWIQVKIELENQTEELKIEKLSVEAKKEKTDFPAKLALQENREIEIKLPCAIVAIDANPWSQSEFTLQSPQQIKLHLGKGGDGDLKLSCSDKKFSIPVAVSSSFEHVYYRIDGEWVFVELKLSKDNAPANKSLDTIKHSIEKELGFSFK